MAARIRRQITADYYSTTPGPLCSSNIAPNAPRERNKSNEREKGVEVQMPHVRER